MKQNIEFERCIDFLVRMIDKYGEELLRELEEDKENNGQEKKEENEKKKEYLKSYQRAVKRERDILEEIKRLRADKMFPSVVNDGMPKGSSQSDLSDYIAILDEQIEILKKERLNKVQQYRKIESQIRKMHSEDERKVLRLRYIKGLKWDDVATEMEETDGVTLHKLAEGRVKYLAWNKYCPTWENRDAVKAVFMALNQEEIVKGAYGDSMGTTANSVFSNRNLFYDKDVKGYEQNLDEAKKLAQSSGLAGKTITLHYNTDRSYMEATALLIQEQLKAIDVNVDIQGIDANGFFDVVFTDKDDYELYLNEYAAIGDPGEVVAGMFDGTWGNNIDTPQEILDLFEQGRKTTDVEKRTEIYKELQEKAMESYLTYPIAYPNYCFATSDNLEGAETYSTTPVFEDYTKLSFK